MNSLARGPTASAAGRYPVALYGSETDNAKVAAPAGRGFTHLSTLSDALSQPDRLQKLPHFEQLVYPQWLHDLQQGKAVTAAPAGHWKVIEAAWGAPKFYLLNHIPGAGYIDTNEVEANRCGIKSPMRS
jgi:thiosulfate/3-mercaptopyruvate sulfurtransferase